MSKPLVVVIPHQLGRAEARRRLVEGVDHAKMTLQRYAISVAQADWTGDHLAFAVGALGQRVEGHVDVEEASVRLEIKLPWLLAIFAERAQKALSKEGSLMLEKKPAGAGAPRS